MPKPITVVYSKNEDDLKKAIGLQRKLGIDVKHAITPQDFLKKGKSRVEKPEAVLILGDSPPSDADRMLLVNAKKSLDSKIAVVYQSAKITEEESDELKKLGARACFEGSLSLSSIVLALNQLVNTKELHETYKAIAKSMAESESESFKPKPPIPELDSFKQPEVLTQIMQDIFPLVVTVTGELEKFDDIEKRVAFYAERLEPFQERLIKEVTAKSKEKDLDLEQCIRLVGVNVMRNRLIAMHVADYIKPGVAVWDNESGKCNFSGKDFIPSALKAESYFGEESRYRYIAFASGLLFDICKAASHRCPTGELRMRQWFLDGYAESIKKADDAFKIGKKQKKLELEMQIIPAMFMHQTSTLLMCMYIPGYIDWLERHRKKNLPISFRRIDEIEKFGISHNIVGALLASTMTELFKSTYSILFFDGSELLYGDEFQKSKDLIEVLRA